MTHSNIHFAYSEFMNTSITIGETPKPTPKPSAITQETSETEVAGKL